MALGRVCLAADVSVVAMTPDLGAEIRGVDLSAPLSDACFARILEVLLRYGVVFLRNQELDPRLLVRFAARFGELEAVPHEERPLAGLPQVGVLSAAKGEDAPSEPAYWHSDHSYERVPPALTLLYGKHGVEGGSAEFVNMYSVFHALPEEKRLFAQKLRGVHVAPAQQAVPGTAPSGEPGSHVEHPLVRVHPETGRKALYLAKDVVVRAAGLRADDSRQLLEQLEAFATQPRFVYAHRWRKGDLLVWDNRCTLQRWFFRAQGDRTLYRIRVKGEAPIAA